MSDEEKIQKLMAKHYQIMATKNVWYNPQWYKACVALCVMASNLRARKV